ncbi:vitamin B12 ABC transporter ATP-binding protein BtuD [Veronia nyctiphanis]|uniref:Vitamin B12 ABC transporter ATP-binding protein BtuD n=2 Tax=Veronia nyctiphanis TaxID=1278244 RepID=A0A4Q0YVY0_9GAMM|nr:vitamin B12 ABC transporter ATP-binding protein BtuD [Veronia nyctiphanis]
MIQISDLSLPPRLLPVNLTVNKGELIHILGPNGSGKSTLLELVSGLEYANGRVYMDGVDVSTLDNQTLATVRGYLSQQGKPQFSVGVYQYLYLCLNAMTQTDDPTKVDRVVKALCERLEINDKLSRGIDQLSGGEWQRVRLAGVFLQVWPELNPNGKVLLLDEPASALDIAQQDTLYEIIKELSGLGIAILMANHDLNRSINESDRVILMKSGHITHQGTPKEVMTPDIIEQVFSTRLQRHDIYGRTFLL